MTSIRIAFPLIFVSQIFVAVGLTGAIAYVSHMSEARETAGEILDLIGGTMDDQLYQFVSVPINLTEIFAEGVRSRPKLRFDDLTSPEQTQKIIDAVWAQSQMSRWVNLNIANPLGQSLRIDRKEFGKQIVKLSDVRNGGAIRWYRLAGLGHEEPLEVQPVSYDPRQQPYYREANARKGLILSPIHFSPLVRAAPVVTVAEPVYDARGHLRIVVSSDIYLQGISSYLRGLRLPASSAAFIFDREGQLVASSRPDAPASGPRSVERRLSFVLEDAEPAIRSTVESLVQRFGSFDVPEAISFHYVSANQRRYVYAAHLFTEFGLNWNLAVVIGESDLIDHLMQGIHSTAWVTLALLALAILVGMLTARSMARPILTLGAVASALEKDRLDDRHIDVAQLEKDGRQNNEFGELARTFLRTVREVEARHTLLEAQLEQLRVDIDPADTQAEVVQVVQSEFFRSLKEQASSLRRQRTQRTRPADPA